MRKVPINDPKLTKILEARAEVHKRIGEINQELVRWDNERTKEGYKMNRLKDKTVPIIEQHKNSFNLGEFEIIASVSMEAGQPQAEIIDQVEEYKQALREKNDNRPDGDNQQLQSAKG